MKTLYININNEQINSTEELEVLSFDLDNDFFFHLGEKIANGCKVKNEAELITDFNSPENEDAYNDIISQWKKLKEILFSENCSGIFNFTLPEDYIHWLKFNINAEYISIYDANFSNSNSAVIHINLNDLYDDTIGYLQRKISHTLQKDNLHLKIKEFVFNDNIISHKSPIVKSLKNKYGQIDFCHHNKYTEHTENKLLPQKAQSNNEFITEIRNIEPKKKAITNVINALQTKKRPKSYSKPERYSWETPRRYSWQTDEYLAIIKQDQDSEKLRQENKNNHLLFDNFFPVCGITLNKSTLHDVEQQAYLYKEIKYRDDGNVVVTTNNGASIWKWGHTKCNVFTYIYIVNDEIMFPEWSKLGFDWCISYNDWISLFKRIGFTIIQIQEPRVTSWEHGPDYLDAEFVATSKDYLLKFKLKFSYGKDGSTQISPSTLYSITVET